MTTIKLITTINAPIKKVFNLSRNIDVHLKSTEKTKESAIYGRTSGCMELGETVRWRGKHFGLFLEHESIITALETSSYFVDEMKDGLFKWLKHEHLFYEKEKQTIMTDVFSYQTPFGVFGWIFDQIILKKHLVSFLKKRNNYIKKIAEK